MTAKAALKRIRRTIAVVLYAALATGFVWLAITRWNGVPADASGAGIVGSQPPLAIDPKWDRTDELVAALAALPPPAKIVLPPAPPGMRWGSLKSRVMEPSDILYGEWTPETRPNLQTVVAYLKTEAVKQAMERFAAIRLGGCRSGAVSLGAVRQAARLFAGRARYRHVELGDIDGALSDLETVYRLASIGLNSGDSLYILTALACEGLADEALRPMAHENSFTRAQAARVLEITRAVMSDKREMWRCVTASKCDALDQLLDLSYTDDGHGNGWLVLSHLDDVTQPTWALEPRSGAWNLLSILFNNRRTVAAKLKLFRQAYEKIGELSYDEARAAAEVAEARASFFSILDGPLGLCKAGSNTSAHHEITVRHVASQSANVTAAALSAYRRDHGEYPPSLQFLLVDYLDELPLDPYVDQPLRYIRQQEGEDYLLYAVGPNQIDDGGQKPTQRRGFKVWRGDGDRILEHSRRETSWEPKLEVVEQ